VNSLTVRMPALSHQLTTGVKRQPVRPCAMHAVCSMATSGDTVVAVAAAAAAVAAAVATVGVVRH